MTKAEIATYLGMANLLLNEATKDMKPDERTLMDKCREALMAAQLLLTEQAIQEVMSHDK